MRWYRDPNREILRRVGGPAVEYANGDRYYFYENVIHRLDGPAIEYTSGEKRWIIEGKEYSEAEYIKATTPKRTSYIINSDVGLVMDLRSKLDDFFNENFDNINLDSLSFHRAVHSGHTAIVLKISDKGILE